MAQPTLCKRLLDHCKSYTVFRWFSSHLILFLPRQKKIVSMVTMIHKLIDLMYVLFRDYKGCMDSCTQEGTCLVCRGPVSKPLSVVTICLPAHFSVLWYLQGCMIGGGFVCKASLHTVRNNLRGESVSLAWIQPLLSVSLGSPAYLMLFCSVSLRLLSPTNFLPS